MGHKVLVIIVTYNGKKWVNDVANCINNSNIELDTIIIDNGSSDGTPDLLKQKIIGGGVRKGKKVIVIKNSENLGFGQANNIGFEYAIKNNYDYVYLLNQDARFFEDTIEKLLLLCKKYNDVGIMSPFQCCKGLKKIHKSFFMYLCGQKDNSEFFSDIYFNTGRDVFPEGSPAAHRLIPIDVVKKVGGFSPTFYHYGEDDNYTCRVKFFGYNVYIANHVNVVHDIYDRPRPIEKDIWLSYNYLRNILSNPSRGGFKDFVLVFVYSIYNIYLFKSIKPLINYFKILIEYPKILKNKKESINGKTPFLNIEYTDNGQ